MLVSQSTTSLSTRACPSSTTQGRGQDWCFCGRAPGSGRNEDDHGRGVSRSFDSSIPVKRGIADVPRHAVMACCDDALTGSGAGHFRRGLQLFAQLFALATLLMG